MVDFIQKEAAVKPRVGSKAHNDRQQNGQGREHAQVGPHAVAPTLHREPAQHKSKQVLAKNDVDQKADGHGHRANDHDHLVGQAAAHIGHRNTRQSAQQHFDHQDGRHHRQGSGQPRLEYFGDRLVGRPTVAPIECADFDHELPHLLPQRQVQAQLLADGVDLFLRGIHACQYFRRITPKVMEKKEYQQHDTQQSRNHLQDASD